MPGRTGERASKHPQQKGAEGYLCHITEQVLFLPLVPAFCLISLPTTASLLLIFVLTLLFVLQQNLLLCRHDASAG